MHTAISNAGVAFDAERDLGMGGGVFTGPHALNDKVLAEGDVIPGNPSPVTDISLGRQSMNDQGQIALYVRFENGVRKIVRADPFTLQSVYEAGMAIAAIKTEGDASMSQMVEFAAGNESLAFDFGFPAETGNLVVSLGGHVLVELDALDGVADGLTRFEAEVDLAALFPDGTAEALLQFQLYSNDATAGLYLDNIDFASLVNGDFASGDLSAWQSSFAAGDGVGVAVNPYGPSAAVPEPATILLALLGLALLPRRRRR
jgi:MYXO-CTERM domain-containing protein